MKQPAFVIAFDTTPPATETTVSDPNLVDTPYNSKSWRCFEDAQATNIPKTLFYTG